MKKLLAIGMFALLLAGCLHPYVPDVEQGNVLSQDQVQQLRVGMPKEQVQYIIGDPVLEGTIDSDRWDYVYTMKKGQKPIQEKRLTLYFRNGALYQIKDNP